MAETTISVPVSRAVDKALRLLELAYQLALTHWPISAEQLQQTVIGYQALNGDPAALSRTFERDKADLRQMGIQLETRTIGDDPNDVGYLVPRQQLMLPAPVGSDAGWSALREAASVLETVAAALPEADPKRAGEAACALLSFARDLGLTMPPLTLPAALRQRADHLVDWIHAMLLAAAIEGREGGYQGFCVPVERVAQLVGMDPELVWHVAQRGADRPPNHQTHARQRIRIEAPDREEGIVVIGRLERPWRPRQANVDALIALAQDVGAPLSEATANAVRAFARHA